MTRNQTRYALASALRDVALRLSGLLEAYEVNPVLADNTAAMLAYVSQQYLDRYAKEEDSPQRYDGLEELADKLQAVANEAS